MIILEKETLLHEGIMTKIIVAALYQFTPVVDIEGLQMHLKTLCDQQGIKGILLLAPEGINGTVAGSREAIDRLRAFLVPRFDALEYKESWADVMPFHRMKVRIKKEIVTLNAPEANPSERVGTYVEPKDWNDLISNPDVLVLDTRNDYEVDIGTFQRALNPNTQTFTQFPSFVKTLDKNRPVAMFCTGGIRCEKASSYLLSQGFKNVYHLKGGILKYLETTPPENSLWEGECFVFDGRIAVGHGLELGHHDSCHGCRRPISEEDRTSPFYERGVSCPHCYPTLTDKQRKSARDRQRQEDLAQRRGQKHIGAVMGKPSA